MPATDPGTRSSSDLDDAEVDRIVVRSQRRDDLHQAIVAAVAEIAHFVRQAWHVEERSLRFDGRLLLVAAAALARYDRLTNPRLHARRGYEMQPWLLLADDVRARVRRARDACLADLATLGSVSRSEDLPAARRALRMDSAAQTPGQSATRQRHRDMANIVAINLERRVAALRQQLVGEGRALPGDTMTAIYAIVARAFSGHGETASADTVRRAWLDAKGASAAFRELQKTFEGLCARVNALRIAQAAPSTAPPRHRPRGASTVKKSIDRVLSRKR